MSHTPGPSLRHPQSGAAWQRDTHSYVSDDMPGLRAYQMSRFSSQWIVSVDGEHVGSVYHVIPRDWVSVMDADGEWIASIRGGFDGRENAIRFLAETAKAEGK